MTVFAFCSPKGSPGVTTLLCALGAVWPARRRVVIAECDPSGGDLAARFGLSHTTGMTSLILSRRQVVPDEGASDSHLLRLPGGLEALVGPVSADAAWALDQELAGVGPSVLSLDADILVDCGRFQTMAPGQLGLLRSADHAFVVTRAEISGLAHAAWAVEKLRQGADPTRVHLITVGQGPFGGRETTDALNVRLLGNVPEDREGAAMASGMGGTERAFARSRLVKAASRLSNALLALARAQVDRCSDAEDRQRDLPPPVRPHRHFLPASRTRTMTQIQPRLPERPILAISEFRE